MSDYIVEVVIKDNIGRYNHKIDSFGGTPEFCAKILERKYCNKKNFLVRMYSSLEIAEQEMSKLLSGKK